MMYNRKGEVTMSKITISQEWLKENGEKIKKAYDVSLAKKYDINLVSDVLEILKITDPQNVNEEYAKDFSKVLQLFEKTLFDKLHKKDKVRLPN